MYKKLKVKVSNYYVTNQKKLGTHKWVVTPRLRTTDLRFSSFGLGVKMWRKCPIWPLKASCWFKTTVKPFKILGRWWQKVFVQSRFMLKRLKLGLQNGGRRWQVVVNSGLTVFSLVHLTSPSSSLPVSKHDIGSKSYLWLDNVRWCFPKVN